MTNFDFLKDFNNDLFEIGVKLESDVINSPRAVTADATLFLETLVGDIYRLSGKKITEKLISFYKKIDNLYRQGAISYIFKNKLRDAYNLRNKIHSNQNIEDEEQLAYDLHQRLYYISKKYFSDFADEQIQVPDYVKPSRDDISFENCIICGCENSRSNSNMCDSCNQKINNVNILLSIKNTFKDSDFTKDDLIKYGFSESETMALLIDLSKENVILKKGSYYQINDDRFNAMFEEVDQYIEIALLLTKFYNNEITPKEIKNTLEYWKGGIKQKNYMEFYRLVNLKLEKSFEETLIKLEDVKKSMVNSSMDDMNIMDWFENRKELFLHGELNDAFILYNELLIGQYFALKKKNFDDAKISSELNISPEILEFWRSHFMSEEFSKKTDEIKKFLIINEIKKNKTLREVFKNVGISENEFNRLYMASKNADDEFHKDFDKHYTLKRQKVFIKHLKNENLNKAIKISKITRDDFFSWYYLGEVGYDEFYIRTTEILMGRYLECRRQGISKNDILKYLNIPKSMVKSWLERDDLDLFVDFENKNEEITKNLIKRGKIINALKEDKSKIDAINSAELTVKEFLEIYNRSKFQKTDFHVRFDREYAENRKRLFVKILKNHDFYNAIQLCEISQKQFNEWYIKDQDSFIATCNPTEFYLNTTKLLMEKYIEERKNGKNRPDAAKSVGLSNSIIDRWLRHIEYDLYWQFKKRVDNLEKELVIQGFLDAKSKSEVSEIYDIPIKTIDEFLTLGKNGFVGFEKLKNLYEEDVVPKLLSVFLEDIKTKTFNKSLKNSKMSKNELQYYYMLGKSGNMNFKWFHDAFLAVKIDKYVKSVLSKKSHRIALKNSDLTIDEFKSHQEYIENTVFNKRVEIIADEIDRFRSTGTKLAKSIGVDVSDMYKWYFRARRGEHKYREFGLIFEIGVIIPRVIIFSHARVNGMPKNLINKKLKKDLGSEEYQIWKKHGLLDLMDIDSSKAIGAAEISQEQIADILGGSDLMVNAFKNEDMDEFGFLKKAFKANQGISIIPISMSK